jgi:hypothetical protein
VDLTREINTNGDDDFAGGRTIILLDKGATCIDIVSLRRLQNEGKEQC